MISVLLVEDQPIIRMGLEMAFSDSPDVFILDMAENGKVAVEKYIQGNPDVVLMDINMPIMNGLEAAKRIKSINRNVKIVFLTSNDNLADVFDAFSIGANGYCIKDIAPKKLIESIKSVYKNGLCLDARLAESMLQFVASKDAMPTGTYESVEDDTLLNNHEVALLQSISKGASQDTIDIVKKLRVINLLNKIVLLNKATQVNQTLPLNQQYRNSIANNYEILEELGNGASGCVFKARNRKSDRNVAMKIFKEANNLTYWQRFVQEASIMSKLSHPNIVSVQDFILDGNGVAYMVMDLVDGPTLATVLECGGGIVEKEAIPLILHCLNALHYLHNAGIIHRDLKPSNIIVYSEDQNSVCAKLTDFGISKNNFSDDARFTVTGEILGSPLYMSPEQCRGEDVDYRADIYSMGCVMFEILLGYPPYLGKTIIETMYSHINFPIPKMTGTKKTISKEMQEIVERTLAKKPEERFQNVFEVIEKVNACK